MKKILSMCFTMMMLFLCFTLVACGSKYVSKYSAMLMISTNTPTKASVSFDTFNGTYVMNLTNKGNDKVFIDYNAKLEKGNINVYIDYNDEKSNLFEITGNDFIEGSSDTLTSNKRIYIIIESDGKCKEGNFSFVLKKLEEQS